MQSTLPKPMTSDHHSPFQGNFVMSKLPWLLAGALLTLYLLTLNHWIGLGNLVSVARISGWSWHPDLFGPVYYLVTLPLRLLPAVAVPFALNLVAAVCAALVIALLARTVALLPYDRTHDQRERERGAYSLLSVRCAWIPPVLAAVVCGLQLSFWENATMSSTAPPLLASSEMLDLLFLAYAIRCVMEYRVDERESWLTRASLVYAIGMTNNWAMIGYFPLFIAALIRVKGLAFFEPRFLLRMFFWGFPGLLFYFLLPVISAFSEISHVPFWQALKANLGAQKYALLWGPFNKRALFDPNEPTWVLGLPSLLPILIIAIRWPSFTGDTSRHGNSVLRFTFHLVHALFLGVCVWVALDPPFSPRSRGFPVPLLSFYYLGAITVGYCSGYFLLLASRAAGRWRRGGSATGFVNSVMRFAVWALLFAVPALLIYRNLPNIRLHNGHLYQDFAQLIRPGLPEGPAVILSDDPRRMLVVQAAAARWGRSKDWIFIDTASLAWADYHRFLQRLYAEKWPSQSQGGLAQSFDLDKLLRDLSSRYSMYYLHPSFGYYFETFSLEPTGLVYKLVPYATNNFLAPKLSPDLYQKNEEFWSRTAEPALDSIRRCVAVGKAGAPSAVSLERKVMGQEEIKDAAVLGSFYSHCLVYWGTEQQKHGDVGKGSAIFKRAIELNPLNPVAQINYRYSTNLQAGVRAPADLGKWAEEHFGRFFNWQQLVANNGPFDEPTFCFVAGIFFRNAMQLRQAAAQLIRATELDPDFLSASLALANVYLLAKQPDTALQIAEKVRNNPLSRTDRFTGHANLAQVEAYAHLAKNAPDLANARIKEAVRNNPNNLEVLSAASQFYLVTGAASNALEVLERELVLQPTNTAALLNKGAIHMMLKAYDNAIPAFSTLLQITNEPTARAQRALAFFHSGKLDEAQQDWQSLSKTYTNDYQPYFGLAEVAYRKGDTNLAVRNLELYMSKNPPAEGLQRASARLKEILGSP
jgi:tetratricopeptide (TPR) repeat protein